MSLINAKVRLSQNTADHLEADRKVFLEEVGVKADVALMVREASQFGRLPDLSNRRADKLISDIGWMMEDLIKGNYVVVGDSIQPSEDFGSAQAKKEWDKKTRTWVLSEFTISENYTRIFG